jgi:1,4-alpha-glucan branching enzyme
MRLDGDARKPVVTQTGRDGKPSGRGTKKMKSVGATSVSRDVANLRREHSRPIEVTVRFKVEAPSAKTVAVAGTFNGWDPRRTPLRRVGAEWHAEINLVRGQYEYRFVVDGEWMPDPHARESAANPFGGVNSVLTL